VYNENYYHNRRRHKGDLPSSVPAGLTGVGIGAVGGALAGAVKENPYMVNGIPSDTFAKLSYEKYLKKAPDAERKAYGQCNEVISKIDGIRTTDELKTLLKNNPEASKEVSTALNKTTEEYLKGVSDTNLVANKEVIKKKLEVANESRFQNMKNEITRAWNGEKKVFIKPNDMDRNLFSAIKKTSRTIRAKVIGKYAAIGAAVTGAVVFAAHKIINLVKHRPDKN
jgi:hypothetical protein